MVDQINILYKYRPIDKHTIKLLVNNELHFSIPSELNDPYDCDTFVEYGGTKEEFHEWIKLNGDNEDINKTMQSMGKMGYDPTLINSILAVLLQRIKDKVLIYCLAEKRDNTLMWAHYSDSHKGLCLGFKTSQ